MITSNPHPGHRLPPAEPSGLAGPEPSGSAAPSPLTLIDDRLRGRWRIAVLIGIVLGALGAAAGWMVAPVKYAGRGTIHVIPTGSPILRETSETDAMPRYESLIKTQAVFVRSPRVIQDALDDRDNLELQALPLVLRPNALEHVIRNLRAEAVHQTELVSVAYESEDAREAQVVVNAVLASYQEIHGSERSTFRNRRRESLQNERTDLVGQRRSKRAEIQGLIDRSEYGATNPDRVLEMKLVRIEELRQEAERLEVALRMLEGQDDDAEGTAAVEPTEDELDLFDPELAAVRRSLKDQEIALAQLLERYPETNLIIRSARRDIGLTRAQLTDRERTTRDRWLASAGGLAPFGGAAMTGEDIELQAGIIREKIDENRSEVRSLNREQAQLADLQLELEEIERQLDEVDETLRMLDIESQAVLSGHIEITPCDTAPREAATDRRLPMAVVGFGGGLGASFAFFFLLGSLDRRAFSANQLREELTGLRCLGVLPDLGRTHAEPEMNETAAQCVHQIRNRIEAQRRCASSFVLVVSSPFQGDGKTSLSMALGWSYAAAGYRTLLVDGDLIGQALTHQLGASGRPGLREVLRDRQLQAEHVLPVPLPNLFVLGAGLDPRFGPESIRRDDFEALARELRRDYDVVIVDTGPAIGSVELFPVASASDGVVFSVRRGRSRSSIDTILEDLAAMHVAAFGVILNCADHADCERYVSKSTVSRRIPDLAETGEEGAAAPSGDGNHLVRAIERASEARGA